MKILTRYIIKNILLVFFIAFLIFSFLVMAVESFMHLDSFMTGNLTVFNMFYYAFLSLSEYYMMLIGIALLFSITYFLSNLSANNELISLYTAGLSKLKILRPVIILSIIFTIFFFFFSESAGLIWKNRCSVISTEYFGLSGTQDARRPVLYDEHSGLMIYAERYSESNRRLYSPILIKTENNSLKSRTEADYAEYSGGSWTFYNARIVHINEDKSILSFTDSSYVDSDFNLSEELFRSNNMNIETMDLEYAYDYLKRLEGVNRMAWQEGMTEFLTRLSEPVGILILSIIAMSMNYTYKKNILLFSIVQSLVIAVVYYVATMVFSIASNQGAVSAYSMLYAPPVITILLSYVIAFLGKKL